MSTLFNTIRTSIRNQGFVQAIIFCVLIYISSGFTASYLHAEPLPLFHLTLFLIGIISAKCAKNKRDCVSLRTVICFSIFSLFFSISIVLGYHIITGDSLYFGTSDMNYISSYGIIDLVALLFVSAYSLFLAIGVYVGLSRLSANRLKMQDSFSKSPNSSTNIKSLNFDSIKIRSLATTALIIFIAYMPYFFVYCPGLEFGDSYHSLAQATGEEPWNNHHPVVYSFFIKCCLMVSGLFGLGIGAGRAIYSIIQMAFMAVCFAYMIQWITTRFSLNKYYTLALIVIFACTPYIASYSIAMWKDPVFSVSIMMLTLLLADLICSNGKIAKRRSWLFSFMIFTLLSVFLRSNGIFIVALIGVILLIVFAKKKRLRKQGDHSSFAKNERSEASKEFLKPVCISFCSVALCLLITGPVYAFAGINPAPKVEGYGIFLNQMARVVATNGSMSESDQEYMNEILPLERYAELYTPCCIDQLKWSEGFNDEALEDGFFEHWLSMLAKNPISFFESWELETFGWWAVNQPSINTYSTNIASGVPGSYHNLLKDDKLQEVFPLNTWSIPASWILWLVLYLIALLISEKRIRLIIPLIPTFGLFATLLIASPICYWPRYAAAAQFLIPFYCALLLLSARSKEKTELRNTKSCNTGL